MLHKEIIIVSMVLNRVLVLLILGTRKFYFLFNLDVILMLKILMGIDVVYSQHYWCGFGAGVQCILHFIACN